LVRESAFNSAFVPAWFATCTAVACNSNGDFARFRPMSAKYSMTSGDFIVRSASRIAPWSASDASEALAYLSSSARSLRNCACMPGRPLFLGDVSRIW